MLDATDWRMLDALQRDGRISVAALGRLVGLGPTATGERLARLMDSGVIARIQAVLNPSRVGLPLTAFVRMRNYPGTTKALLSAIEQTPEVVECHHTTGEDCYMLQVHARNMQHLEEVTERIAGFGQTTTTLAYSSPVPRRPIAPN